MESPYNYEKMDRPELLAFMFHPRPAQDTTPSKKDQVIDTPDGEKLQLRYHMTEDHSTVNILFFHGNGETIEDYEEIAAAFNRENMSFIITGYRGYGLSTGKPSATSMMNDAHLILKAAEKRLVEMERSGLLLAMGRSLGCAPAIELASLYPEQVKGVLLDSGFANTIPVLKNIGGNLDNCSLTENDCFRNLDKIKTVANPVYLIHGQKDDIVDLKNSSLLHAECPARQKEIQIVPGADHNSIFQAAGPMYFTVMKRFIDRIGTLKPKRRGVL